MSISIRTFPTYRHVGKTDFRKKTAVVVDVLRATSTITTALSNGCLDVTPVKHIGDAFAQKNEYADGVTAYIGGERGGRKVDGFDLGNSPLEYSQEKVNGCHLVLCTTNGTQAIAKAEYSDFMFMGCLNNVSAVAEAAADAGRDIIILCSGTELEFSIDDVVAAGAVIDRMLSAGADIDLDDLGATALYLYRENRNDIMKLIGMSKPFRILSSLGAEKDIEYCIREDIKTNVPVYKNGKIVNL